QAEDGIRDRTVTGVQTCALPICDRHGRDVPSPWSDRGRPAAVGRPPTLPLCLAGNGGGDDAALESSADPALRSRERQPGAPWTRSEERRVGKECRSRWAQ